MAAMDTAFWSPNIEQREGRSPPPSRAKHLSDKDLSRAIEIYNLTCTSPNRLPNKKSKQNKKSRVSEDDQVFASNTLVEKAHTHMERNDIAGALRTFHMSFVLSCALCDSSKGDSHCEIEQMTTKILQSMASIHLQQNEYKFAIQKYLKAVLRLRELTLFINKNFDEVTNPEEQLHHIHDEISSLLLHVGILNERMGQYAKCHKSYNESLKMKRLTNLCNPMIESSIMMRIANALSLQGKYDKAFELFQQVLDIRMESTDTNSSLVAESYNSLAQTLIFRCYFEDAEVLCFKSLDILKHKSNDNDKLMMVNTYRILGTASLRLGYTRDAMKHYKTAMKIRSNIHGVSSPSTAEILLCMAELHAHNERFDEAIKVFKEALRLQEIELGVNHFSIAATLNKLGSAYMRKKELKKAIRYHKLALDINRKCSGDFSHPSIGETLNHIGNVLKRNGEREDAMNHYTDALEIFRSAELGVGFPGVAKTIKNIAEFQL